MAERFLAYRWVTAPAAELTSSPPPRGYNTFAGPGRTIMTLRTVKVPAGMEPTFAQAEALVAKYFAARRENPAEGKIEIFGERYVLIRAASLSVEFFSLVRRLFGDGREAEADEFARDILFDLAHALGRSDAQAFHARMNLKEPIERLAAGPVHFSHSGWAFVDIFPESNPVASEAYCLLYDHPYSFEADAWIRAGRPSDGPVCVMNAGYSSGWCQESFGLNLVASEILCRARGDECCRFVMAPPDRIEQRIAEYAKGKPELAGSIRAYRIPDFLVRQRMEQALRDSEAGLKQVQALAHVGSWQQDLKDGTVEISDELRRILFGDGLEPKYPDLPQAIDAIVHPEDRQRVLEAAAEAGRNHTGQPMTFRIVRPDGQVRCVLATEPEVRRHAPDGTPKVMIGAIQDVTEEKQAQEAIMLAKQRWERTFDSVPDLIAILDTNYRIVQANKAMADRLGCTTAECAGRTCYQAVHGTDAPPPFCPQAQLMKDHQGHMEEIADERLGGVFLVTVSPMYDAAGQLVGCVHVARDITQQRKVEEQRRIRDRMVASSVNPIATADLEGKLTYVNDSFLRVWGCSDRRGALGREVTDFWHMSPEARAELHQRGNWSGRVSGRSSDSTPLDLQLSASIVLDEQGRPLCVAYSFVNVTEISHLRRRLKAEQSFAGIIGRDEKMLELFEAIREVAEAAVPVMIQGESGTGKELVAAAIHSEGPRAEKAFVPVNCGALPEGILESELFGHVKGAFTGAIRDRKGRFELARDGTIFLDEVADIPPAMQVKLLRVLQEGTFERVGGEETIHTNARIISATNRDLHREVVLGRFREDLYYRLAVVPVTLPALRERPTDIPLLAEHLLKRALADTPDRSISLSQQAIQILLDYRWPGNVRELENAIQYALVKCEGDLIEPRHLPPTIRTTSQASPRAGQRRQRKRKLDAASVREALQATGGNKLEAAKKLGVGRATLYRFLSDQPLP